MKALKISLTILTLTGASIGLLALALVERGCWAVGGEWLLILGLWTGAAMLTWGKRRG